MTPVSGQKRVNEAFVGIDVAFAKRKRLPVSVCTWRDGRLVPEALRLLNFEPPRGQGNVATLDDTRVSEFVREAVDYVVQVCDELRLAPRRIAIDAPSAPRAEGVHRRAAEVAMDKAGISCFPTPTATEFDEIREKVRRHLSAGGPENRLPHANQLWMLVGFRLFEELAEVAECIEVFPQATARVLGAASVHKGKAGGVEAQLAEAARHTGWPGNDPADPAFSDIGFGPAHDRLDAYLSAWVAALEESDRIPFGEAPGDVIWTPRVGLAGYEKPKAGGRIRVRSRGDIHTRRAERVATMVDGTWLERISQIQARADEPDSPIRPTEVFNEGWMLRLTLDWIKEDAPPDHPFGLEEGSSWSSEALLPSAFLPRRRGDSLGEGWTNADACVGHFVQQPRRGNLSLEPEAAQFIVIEAKMFSGLSRGTKNAPGFDQAARNVACIAEVLRLAGRVPDEMTSLAFLVTAPQAQIEAGIFGDLVTQRSIRGKVMERVASYSGGRDEWLHEWFEPVLESLRVELLSWESLLVGAPEALTEFYALCLKHNERKGGQD